MIDKIFKRDLVDDVDIIKKGEEKIGRVISIKSSKIDIYGFGIFELSIEIDIKGKKRVFRIKNLKENINGALLGKTKLPEVLTNDNCNPYLLGKIVNEEIKVYYSKKYKNIALPISQSISEEL